MLTQHCGAVDAVTSVNRITTCIYIVDVQEAVIASLEFVFTPGISNRAVYSSQTVKQAWDTLISTFLKSNMLFRVYMNVAVASSVAVIHF